MIKAAGVYQRKNDLYVCSYSKTTVGVWIGAPPRIKLRVEDSAAAKGEALFEGATASQHNVTHPAQTDWDGLLAPLLELAGVKSWSTFMKNAASVFLEAEDGRLRFISYRNRGRRGFEQILENGIDIPYLSSPEVIGAALEEALARCR